MMLYCWLTHNNKALKCWIMQTYKMVLVHTLVVVATLYILHNNSAHAIIIYKLIAALLVKTSFALYRRW
jgi:hypothetical protein